MKGNEGLMNVNEGRNVHEPSQKTLMNDRGSI